MTGYTHGETDTDDHTVQVITITACTFSKYQASR